MEFELQALTEPGKLMIELAEKHAADFAVRAAEHDRDGTFPFENIAAMKKSGFAAAAVPKEFGGMGVTSIHDSVVAVSRLGRGDGATPLAFTMHLFRTLLTVRTLRGAIASGNQARRKRSEELLKKIGAGELIIAVANAERGANIRTSRTLATRVEGGWLFNGTKSFATGSPAADVLAVRARYENEVGESRLGAAVVPVTRPGLEIMDNWDGMGMRASGSHDVVFTDYFVKDEEFVDIGEFGKFNAPFLAVATATHLGLCSPFLGIAESAHELALTAIKDRDAIRNPMNQVTAAENEIDLAATRAVLSRAAQTFDDFYQTAAGTAPSNGPSTEVPEADAFQLIKSAAIAKKFVTDRSCVIVDRAVTLYGGGAFLNNNTLARLYRDVRAGPLMQPWARDQAVEIIGKVALGVDPNED